ncbi:unnamed protein product, partial [Urochloa humidicola]
LCSRFQKKKKSPLLGFDDPPRDLASTAAALPVSVLSLKAEGRLFPRRRRRSVRRRPLALGLYSLYFSGLLCGSYK